MAKKAKFKPIPGAVISEDEKRSPLRFLKSKKFLLGSLIILLVVIIGIATVSLWKYKDRTVVVCRSGPGGIIQEATEGLKARDIQKLQPVVEKIKQLPNYEQDPNCLYPMVVYYASISDRSSANMYYAKLEKAYDPKVGFAQEYQQVGASMENVKKQVEFVDNLQQQINNNAIYSN